MSTKHEVQVKTFQNMEGLKNVLSRALMFSEIYHGMNSTQGFPGDSVVKNPLANAGVRGRKWQSTPVFLPGKSHGQGSLVGYSPWGRKRIRHDLAAKQREQQHSFILSMDIY